jgi:hypothetical protein
MTDVAVAQLLAGSGQRTLETMFFAIPDGISSDTTRPEGELFAAEMTFDGSRTGRFGVILSAPVARTIAADFLGAEDELLLAPERIEEVVGELANIICGSVLSEIGETSQFNLSTPIPLRSAATDPGPAWGNWPPVICRLEMPRGSIILNFAFENAR